jgi:hypothetical protein
MYCVSVNWLEKKHNKINIIFYVCGSVHLGGNMFHSNPTGCTIFFSLEKFLALHVSDVICIHHQEHNCRLKLTALKCQSVPKPVPAPWNKHTKTIKIPMAVHYSCAPHDGCK